MLSAPATLLRSEPGRKPVGSERNNSPGHGFTILRFQERSQSWFFCCSSLLSLRISFILARFFQSRYLLISVALLAGLFGCICELRSPKNADTDQQLLTCFVPFWLFFLLSIRRSCPAHKFLFCFLALLVWSLFERSHSILKPVIFRPSFSCASSFVVNLYCIYQYFIGLSKLKACCIPNQWIQVSSRHF
jgi:hypothetical protein